MKKKKPKKQSAKKGQKEKGFEDCIDTIDEEIAKKRFKWNLTSLAWMDFEDVSQILRFHKNIELQKIRH